ncbi:hypothetical protein [Bacillus weihaiensis]|uniref:Uncharacterized protein n=1 Tax=Bacillus weihaiensis TaxID=1547283 RepID=A0A1L3MV30_9BACI|nr:hypothetical protein [Bacillus weihaiensis]APH06198.1 hypothetical protein A9C19_16410 [Bacillus weihaiensis]
MILIHFVLVILFIIGLFISLKFTFGKEGKDERGQQILNISYMFSFPIFPIGWLLIETYHKYINTLTFDSYRDSIWILVLITFIVQGLVILFFKRKL